MQRVLVEQHGATVRELLAETGRRGGLAVEEDRHGAEAQGR